MTITKDKSKKSTKYKMTQDVFFKRCMTDKTVAKEFFESYLPKKIRANVDFSTLKLEKSDFADATLGKGISDILYSVLWNNKKGYISLLLEHQSTSDTLMTFRIFKYMLKICDLHITQTKKKELPLVYPAILYTGKGAYTAPRSFFDLFPDPKLAKQFFTDPVYLLSLMDIDDIDLRNKYHMGAVLSLMKEIHQKNIFPHIEKLAPLFQLLARENLHLVQDMLLFILHNANAKNEEKIVQLLIESVPEERRNDMRTIADSLIEKGELRGIEKGIEKVAVNMLASNISIDTISIATKLSLSEIEKLKKKRN